MAVLPLQRLVRMGQHIFVDALEFLADRIVLIVRPESRENVVGPLAEQQVVLAHDELVERADLAPEWLHPATEAEAAGWVLFRPAGRLDDSVERDENSRGDLTH